MASQEQPSPPAEQSLVSLVGQMHATLIEILKQQNDRIAQLEAGPVRITRTSTDEPEEMPAVELDIVDDASIPKERLPEPAHFSSEDFAMVMSVWPDPGQAVMTNTSSKLDNNSMFIKQLRMILNSCYLLAYDHYHALYGAVASSFCVHV